MCKYFALVLMLLGLSAAATAENCPITPVPKVYKEYGVSMQLQPSAVIVVGEKADQVDQYAAQRLQALIAKRFGVTIAIASQSSDSKQVIVLGRPETNAYLAKLCAQNKTELSPDSPGFDGYVIETIKDKDSDVVLIGGTNARGVTYGMMAFFDLLKKDGDKTVFPSVSVRDKPSIMWRGRNGGRRDDDAVFDSYVRARINFTDTQEMVGHKHRWKIDEEKFKAAVDKGHKRGMFIYGVVNCAIEPDEFDKAVAAFEKVINLGVDGIWLSFDDAGEGVDAVVLVKRVLEVAHKHKLSGHDIVMTPPTGSYQFIETQWNKTMAAQPGFNEITSFFTINPGSDTLKTARQIGLTKTMPAWWYNWPRYAGGLLNGSYGTSLYDKTPYFEVPPIEFGWHMPTYKELVDADKFTDMVGICAGGAEEYVMPAFGIWAWSPATANYSQTRAAIYSDVFGPGQVQTAQKFDDDFVQLKSLYTKVRYKNVLPNAWPPRLKDPNNKALAAKLAGNMQDLFTDLRAKAPSQSLLAADRLKKVYFEPMADTVEYAQKFSSLEFPEYWLPNFSAEMQKLVETDPQKATDRINAVKDKAMAQVTKISTELAHLNNVNAYVDYWRSQLSGVEYWQKLVGEQAAQKKKEAKSRQQMAKIFPSVVKGNYDDLLAAQNTPPKEGKVLAVISPAEWAAGKLHWSGDCWDVGLYKSDKYQAVAIGCAGDKVCKKDDSAELGAEIIIPKYKGRLKAQVFVAQCQKGQTPQERQARFSVLITGRSWAWMQDAGNLTKDNEWVTLELLTSHNPPVEPGESFSITLLVTNTKDTKFESVVLFGPIRLIEEE